MTALDCAAWAATAAILGTYLLSVRRPDHVMWFHRANAIGCIPIGVSALAHHAYPSAAITVAFGGIGLMAIDRQLRQRWSERPFK